MPVAVYMVHMNQQAFSFSWRDRFASWWYRIGFLLLLSWFGVGVTMCLGKNSTRSDDGSCMIGLKVWATGVLATITFVTLHS